MIKVAALWIVNEYGELLLAQRALDKRQDPGVWGPSVTGKLEPGESFDEALVRETQEELALTTANYIPKFLMEMDFDHPDGEQRKYGIYYATLPKAKTALIHIDTNEVAGFDWFSLATVEDKMKSNPKELVPSANAIWHATFQALKDAGVL